MKQKKGMMSEIFRAVALMMASLLVAGGGLCSVLGVPFSLFLIFDKGDEAFPVVVLATAVGFCALYLGLWMWKLDAGSKS